MAGTPKQPAQPKAPTPHVAQKATASDPSLTQSAKPMVAAAVAPAPIVPPAPIKIPLEASIKKTVSDRRDVLVINLRKENEDEVKREEEVRLAKERILKLETEIEEIDTFLARA